LKECHFNLKKSKIKEVTNVTEASKATEVVMESLSALVKIEREILTISDKANDEGTSALMSDYIRQQEKLIWMYSAYEKRN
jgi:starvation-inducible DNA-binding protein